MFFNKFAYFHLAVFACKIKKHIWKQYEIAVYLRGIKNAEWSKFAEIAVDSLQICVDFVYEYSALLILIAKTKLERRSAVICAIIIEYFGGVLVAQKRGDVFNLGP
jgi:hypothetical protein